VIEDIKIAKGSCMKTLTAVPKVGIMKRPQDRTSTGKGKIARKTVKQPKK